MDEFDALPVTQQASLNRFHEASAKLQRYKILFRRRWWFLLLLSAMMVCATVLYITSRPTEYIAMGQLLVGTSVNAAERLTGNNMVNNMMPQDYYGTQIEILESAELRRRVLDRIRSLHSELEEIAVDVRVTQNKGSSILRVIGIGGEAKYTKAYVDALLDEFMAYKREMLSKSFDSATLKILEEVSSREKQVKELKSSLDTFLKNNDVVVFEGDRNQAAAYLTQLKSNLNVYETEKKVMERSAIEDYLKEKERTGGAAAPVEPEAPRLNTAETGTSSQPLVKEARGTDPFGGLSRTEAEFLRAIGELKLLESKRGQMLRTYKSDHPFIRELDEKIGEQQTLIGILREQSMGEWNRRLESIALKIEALQDEIKVWQVKAREANEKIVMSQSLKDEYERAYKDYLEYQKVFERIQSTGGLTSDPVDVLERPIQAIEKEPNLILPISLAGIGGLIIGAILLLLFDRLDDRMNSFSEFAALFPEETILGQIPDQSSRGDVALIQPNDTRHLYAESFRNLRSSLLFKDWGENKAPKTILLTSAVPNEGKTTTVANMAITIAQGGAKVLLVDADLRRGGLNELFKLPNKPGLSEALSAKVHWRDIVQETSAPGLHFIPRGEALEQTSELFLHQYTNQVLKEMESEYDYVIFDSAPVLVADDTSSLAPKMEAVIFVVRMSSTMARLSAKALDHLYERQVNVVGVILNRTETNMKEYTYYNYASYYSNAKRPKAKA